MTEPHPPSSFDKPTDFDEAAEKVRMLLATSRRLMAEGRLVDLTQIEVKIRNLCEQAKALPENSRDAARGVLEGLLGEVDDAQSKLEAQFGAALSALPHREAAQAYTQAYGRPHAQPAEKNAPPGDDDTDAGDHPEPEPEPDPKPSVDVDDTHT
ncbi:hypothetical protein [Varunaivibrio sulfuroxidans]|uniref:Uncharacterized protein n=1 Tax=Varunaivibrio sulfuroxidans TaxID=1773489 RepID=A0A4R3JBF2_9PROT|nr:hypothetical protein [Varunaivibrio sulfuroxidans]TCS63032.1 hypothetical protein EDD55_104123 [Varunaivibrio sulfuroxidans]WES31892.1 hypothetical protein P3M64_05925 [Varunaivibrio sulfuroxidans]